jgi:D-amino-acid dehydrogenase
VGLGITPYFFYYSGHGHLGWTLSAVTAELVSDTIVKAAAKKSGYSMNLHAVAAGNI